MVASKKSAIEEDFSEFREPFRAGFSLGLIERTIATAVGLPVGPEGGDDANQIRPNCSHIQRARGQHSRQCFGDMVRG